MLFEVELSFRSWIQCVIAECGSLYGGAVGQFLASEVPVRPFGHPFSATRLYRLLEDGSAF